ncbi:MAG: hypothetical protein R3B06_03460 [Kofleriaceae bacterium]
MKRLMLMCSLVAAMACGSGEPADPFAADMKMICGAGGRDDVPPEMRTMMAMQEIAEKIKTPEAARLMAAVAQAAPSERAELVKPALAKAGLTRCRLFD